MFEKSFFKKQRIFIILAAAFLCGYLLTLILPDVKRNADNICNKFFFALRYQLKGKEQIAPELLVFTMTESDVKELRTSLFNRHVYSRLMEVLASSEAKSIVFDILFGNTSSTSEDIYLVNQTFKAGNVFHPVVLKKQENSTPISEDVLKKALFYPILDSPGEPYTYNSMLTPYNALSKASAGLGGLNTFLLEGKKHSLLYKYREKGFVPSIVLSVVAHYYGCPLDQIEIKWGEYLRLAIPGKNPLDIPIDRKGGMLINSPGPLNDSILKFSFYSFFSALEKPDKKDALIEGLKGSIVFISDSITFHNNAFGEFPPLNVLFTDAVNTILTKNFIRKSIWTDSLLAIFFWIFIIWLISRYKSSGVLVPIVFVFFVIQLVLSFLSFLFFKKTIDSTPLWGLILSGLFIVIYEVFLLNSYIHKMFRKARTISLFNEKETDLFIPFLCRIYNPLTVIENVLTEEVRRQEYNTSLVSALSSMAFIKQVLSFLSIGKKMRKKAFSFQNEQCLCFSTHLEELLQMFRVPADARKIRIISHIQEQLYLFVDPLAIDMFVQLLMENAMSTLSPGGEIEIFLEKEGDSVILIIRDTGIGMPEEVLLRIRRSNGAAGDRWNLFMMLCRATGGSHNIISREKIGTKVQITFPSAPENKVVLEEKKTSLYSGEWQVGSFQKGKKNMYLVNFQPPLIEYLNDQLNSDYNLIIIEEKKIEEFFVNYKLFPDIFLYDLDSNSFSAKYSFFNNWPDSEDTPDCIIFVCGTHKDRVLEAFMDNDTIQDFIVKPFSLEELRVKLKKWLRFRDNCFSKNLEDMKEYLFKNFSKEKETQQKDKIKKLSLFSEEEAILKYLLKGWQYNRIGEVLNISVNTLKKKIQRIYKKCGVKSKNELIAFFHSIK